MEPRITPAEAALLLPLMPPRSAEALKVEAVVAEARRARDAAIAARIAGLFRAVRGFLAANRRRDETIATLRALDDRQLRDIGVLRGNIAAAAAANDGTAEARRAA